MADAQQQARAAMEEVVTREMMRAGLGFMEPGRKAAMVSSIVAGMPNEDAQAFRDMLEMGDGMNPNITREDVAASPREIFGKPLVEIYDAQRRGWDDYGFTQDKVDKLGRLPGPRELSQGGREAWEWKRRRELTDALMGAGKKANEERDRQQANMNWPQRNSSWQDIRAGLLEDAVRDYQSGEGRTHGQSGWLGSMSNPEYAFGNFMVNVMQPTSDAAYMQYHDEAMNEYPEMPDSPLQDLSYMARAVGNYVGNYIPKAKDLADARTAANKIEPLIPGDNSPAEGRKLLARLAASDAPTYDELHRMQTGAYPSYAGSSAATFLNGLIDPSFLASVPAARAAVMAGKMLAGAGLRMPSNIGRAIAKYGVSVAKDARALAKQGVLQGAKSELVGELPSNAGINSAAAFGPHLNKPKEEEQQEFPPLPDNFLAGGNARTDLNVRDEETGGWRPETDEEFNARMDTKLRDYRGLLPRTPAILRQLPQSPLPQKPN